MRLTDRQHALDLIDRHLETLNDLYDEIPDADEVTVRPFWVRWAVEHTLAEYRCVLHSIICGLRKGRMVVARAASERGPTFREDMGE